jgi:hypothetical protein
MDLLLHWLLFLLWLLLFGDLTRVLGQYANGVVCLLDQGDLGQNTCLELPLLFVISPLFDICDLEPLVLKKILCRWPRVIIDVEATLQDLGVLPCHLLVIDVVSTPLNTAIEVVIGLTSEGEAAIEQCVHEHTSSPDVSRWSCILNFWDDLRSHIAGSSTEHPKLLVVGDACRESKVDELHIFVFIQQNILKLDVSVSDALAMAILERNKNLIYNSSCLLLVELLIDHLFEVAMQAASRNILHDKINMALCLEGLDQLDNIWVIHFLKKDYFSSDGSLPVDVAKLRLVIYLHRVLLIVVPWGGHSHHGIGSLADLAPEHIVVNTILMLGWFTLISILAWVVGRIMVDQDQIITLRNGVFLLQVCIPLLDLVIKLLFQLVHVLYALLTVQLILAWDEGISAWHTGPCTIIIF